MEAVLLFSFATAKSGFPSPLMSPMLTQMGLVPVVKSTRVAKVGVVALVAVVLSRMEAVLLLKFATAKSGFPSPLMSPMLTEWGLVPVVKSTRVAKVGVVALVAVVLTRMEAVLLLKFATAKSGFPSKLKSPMLTDLGPVPVVKSTRVAKVGVVAPVAVVLRRMEAVLLR
jgi:1-acyl-sn-glycerol-3-phosphate acyltransferase